MLKEGQILENKYKIGRLLGKGGMGAVFLGEHTLIKRAVAIKVLRDIDPESENAKRFEREAQAAGRIGSDHIVEVLDLGTTPDGDPFMVMEYLDGESLKQRLARGRQKPAELVPIVTQILEGLAAAHAAGIVHRDLKPDNVFILKEKAGRRDFVKILDFGISKFSALGAEGGMTKTGAVMGTPYYMSPEQARAANEVDNRSDLYSVGVLMYEAVTSSVPFQESTLTALLFKIVFEDPPHPTTLVPDLDPAFATLILKAMARDPNDRFQTAGALLEALVSWREAPRAAAAPGTLPLPPAAPPAATPDVAVPKATVALSGGTAILEASPFVPSAPLAAPPPPVQLPAQNVAQAFQPPPQAPRAPPQAPSQPVEAARPAPKSHAVLFALIAVVVLGIGGAALLLLGRPANGASTTAPPPSASAAPTVATAVVAPPVTATSAPSAPEPEAPSAAPTVTATASASPHPVGARPLPSAKPTGAPAAPSGKLKDLGY